MIHESMKKTVRLDLIPFFSKDLDAIVHISFKYLKNQSEDKTILFSYFSDSTKAAIKSSDAWFYFANRVHTS